MIKKHKSKDKIHDLFFQNLLVSVSLKDLSIEDIPTPNDTIQIMIEIIGIISIVIL